LLQSSMGPRLFRRGNAARISAVRRPQAASMGPRLFRRGNFVPPLAGLLVADTLQWGHAFSDVETRSKHCRMACMSAASMGPRLFRRGNTPGRTILHGSRALQWGHAFSDVETLSSELGVMSLNRFNGATPFQTWKLGDLRSILSPGYWVASMGPRLFRRGNTGEIRPRPDRDPCFNGATPFQTWKRG